MSHSPNDDERLDIERTDELPVLLETVVLDAADPRLPAEDTLEDTSEHTAHYPAFADAEAAELDELKTDLAARGAKIAALETDIARLGARWRDVEQHLSAKDAEIAALKRIVDDVGAALTERREAERKLTVDLATRDTDVTRLRDELTALRNATAAQPDLAALEDDLRSAQDAAAALRGELTAARATATRPSETSTLLERIAALETEVAAHRSAAAESEARASALAKQVAALENESRTDVRVRKQAESIAAAETARATTLRTELVAQARLVESLRRDLAMRRAAEAEPAHATLALRGELVAAQQAAAQATAALSAAHTAHAAAIEALEKRHAEELATLRTEAAATKDAGSDAATQAVPAFEIIAQLEAEVEFKRQQVNAQLIALRERDQRLIELERALELGREESTSTRAELERLRTDVARLERSLVDRDRQVEAKETRIAALQNELNQRLGAVQKLNAMDLSLQGLDSRMSERLRQNDQMPVDNLNTPALVCLTGDAPKQFALTKASIVIGRGAHCDVQVLTHFVSREHARINVVRGNAVIEDLGSTNGVFVNSARVDRHELRQGDLITVGETQFRFLESMAH